MKKQVSWYLVILSVIMAGVIMTKHEPETHTGTFCAYGKVFVEFEEEGHKWGTIMLDNQGHPIPCDEDNLEHTMTKEAI